METGFHALNGVLRRRHRTCVRSILRYNPRHYAEAKNEGPQASKTEASQEGCVRRKVA